MPPVQVLDTAKPQAASPSNLVFHMTLPTIFPFNALVGASESISGKVCERMHWRTCNGVHTRQERRQHPAWRRRRGRGAARHGGLQRGRIGVDGQGLPHHMRHIDERPGRLRHACMLRPIFTHVLALHSNTTTPRPMVAEGRLVARLCWIKWAAACPPLFSQPRSPAGRQCTHMHS